MGAKAGMMGSVAGVIIAIMTEILAEMKLRGTFRVIMNTPIGFKTCIGALVVAAITGGYIAFKFKTDVKGNYLHRIFSVWYKGIRQVLGRVNLLTELLNCTFILD